MQSSKYILSIGAAIGGISTLYFLSLIAHLPFIISAALIGISIYPFIRWFGKQLLGTNERIGNFAVGILIAGAVILTNKVYYIATIYGPWDAWAIWNLNAKYLISSEHWQNMFMNTKFTHPDYPLALPSTIAFFSRLAGGQFNLLIPFAFHFLITLSIPILIFTETYKRSIIVAGTALLLMATNEFYLLQGMHQMADTLLSFFLLCAMVSMQQHKDDPRMLVMSAAFLGCCMWTKNEGVILTIIFCIFHYKEFFGKYRAKYSFAGFALPVVVWAIFKFGYATDNDMVAAQGQETLELLKDTARYKLIYDSFITNLNEHFNGLKWCVLVYLLLCIILRRTPDKRILMILCCMLTYLLVYVVSPNNLEWHLFTSLSRLMHQLMPVTMYTLAMMLAGDSKTTSGFQARFVSIRQRLP
jgi:hypothetical protein